MNLPDVDVLFADYLRHDTLKDVAELYGVGYTTIRKRLLRHPDYKAVAEMRRANNEKLSYAAQHNLPTCRKCQVLLSHPDIPRVPGSDLCAWCEQASRPRYFTLSREELGNDL